jgi:Ca2+-binding RTX toxin-like protein
MTDGIHAVSCNRIITRNCVQHTNLFRFLRGFDSYINGGNGNDTLSGREYSSVYGGAGNDTLTGDYSSLDGGDGNDVLRSLVAATMAGGNGNDTLIGNDQGEDYFEFNTPNEGIDTIENFVVGQDTISVSYSGFGIGQGECNRFTYNSSTGALFFDQTQFAWLEPNLNFDPCRDIG